MKQGHSVSEAVAMGMTKADEIAAEHRKEKDGYWCAMCEYQEDVDRCAFCEDKSEFRKDWKFLTEGEVSKIRNDQCRNCKHVATNGGDSKVGKKYIAGCSYLDDTGHCRKCDPRDCAELGFYERVERRGRRKARPGKF
jgi:hypothetical protein